MNPIIYSSSDVGAPVLNGQAGSLLGVLDGCLVTGYGSKLPLGWTKPFSTTNGGVYRAPTGLRHFLQIIDQGVTTGGQKEAQASAFVTMAAWNAGSGQFPMTGQLANGLEWRKSNVSDASARSWNLMGDDRTFYLFINDGQYPWCAMGFGEFESYKAGDSFNSFLCGYNVFNSIMQHGPLAECGAYGSTSGNPHFYLARAHHQQGNPITAYTVGPLANNNGYGRAGVGPTYPNGPDGGLMVGPMCICEPNTGTPIRGRMRGVYAPAQGVNGQINTGDTATNVQGLPGATLLAQQVFYDGSPIYGTIFVDITGPW